jgi:hypothetical protein
MNARTAAGRVAPFYGWRMVALAWLFTNIATGFTFAGYRIFMSPMAAEFSASRSLASAGLSIMVATMGSLAPVASYAIRRWSIRATLAAGLILLAAGAGRS